MAEDDPVAAHSGRSMGMPRHHRRAEGTRDHGDRGQPQGGDALGAPTSRWPWAASISPGSPVRSRLLANAPCRRCHDRQDRRANGNLVGVVGLLAGTYSVANLSSSTGSPAPPRGPVTGACGSSRRSSGPRGRHRVPCPPRVQKWYAAAPFAVAATVASVGLLAPSTSSISHHRPVAAPRRPCCGSFAVGWSAALAHQAWQRLLPRRHRRRRTSPASWELGARVDDCGRDPRSSGCQPARATGRRACARRVGQRSLYILTRFQVCRLTSMPLVNLALSFGLRDRHLARVVLSTALGGRRDAAPRHTP